MPLRQLIKSCIKLFVKSWSAAALMKIPPGKHLGGSLHGKDVRTIDDDVYDENARVLVILCTKKTPEPMAVACAAMVPKLLGTVCAACSESV